MFKFFLISALIASISAFNGISKVNFASKGLKMSDAPAGDEAAPAAVEAVAPEPVVAAVPAFDPTQEAGVSGPFGFFDPLNFCPPDRRNFMKYRESELKHGRIAMIAVLGCFMGETFSFMDIQGPAIYQYQQAESMLNAWSFNVVGLILAVEGYNIINGWEEPSSTLSSSVGLAALKDTYTNGDLKFDPLNLKPTDPKALKTLSTKELNNGRLAMLGIAGIVAQELVTGQAIF